MKIMNISNTMIFLTTHNRELVPVGMNGIIFANLPMEEFISKNPNYKFKQHYIVIDENYAFDPIQIDADQKPDEIIENAPRLIVNQDVMKIVKEPTEIEIEDEEVNELEECKTQSQWREFLVRQTKDSIKEFADSKKISYPSDANKMGLIEIIIKQLENNNLIITGE
jgi:hypothetical protein